MATPTQGEYAEQIISTAQRLIVLTMTVIANPTQANIDAVLAVTDGSTVLRLKPTYSLDGESYNWDAYLTTLTGLVEKWVALRQVLAGPFDLRTYAG